MDFSFFETLTNSEAKLFLSNFLREEEKGFGQMINDMTNEGLSVDFSIASIHPVLTWLTGKLKTFPEQADENLPVWIRETDSYKKGLYSFDATSKITIMRAAYYMGECFVRTHSQLKWAIGEKETMAQNMPVILGFIKKMEFPPILVCENLFRNIIEDGVTDRIKSVVEKWESFI